MAVTAIVRIHKKRLFKIQEKERNLILQEKRIFYMKTSFYLLNLRYCKQFSFIYSLSEDKDFAHSKLCR